MSDYWQWKKKWDAQVPEEAQTYVTILKWGEISQKIVEAHHEILRHGGKDPFLSEDQEFLDQLKQRAERIKPVIEADEKTLQQWKDLWQENYERTPRYYGEESIGEYTLPDGKIHQVQIYLGELPTMKHPLAKRSKKLQRLETRNGKRTIDWPSVEAHTYGRLAHWVTLAQRVMDRYRDILQREKDAFVPFFKDDEEFLQQLISRRDRWGAAIFPNETPQTLDQWRAWYLDNINSGLYHAIGHLLPLSKYINSKTKQKTEEVFFCGDRETCEFDLMHHPIMTRVFPDDSNQGADGCKIDFGKLR